MNFLQKLYNSRKVLLELLVDRGYDVSAYKNFSMKEIDIMFKNAGVKASIEQNSLDMIIEKDSKKLYIKYVIANKIRLSNIQNLINNMKENVLEEGDSMIILTREKLSNELSLYSLIESIISNDKIIIQLFWLDTLVINITKHELVPKHRVISETEKNIILKKYSLSSFNQLPIILKNDPVAKYYGMVRGDIVEIKRPSETAGEYVSYRYCQ